MLSYLVLAAAILAVSSAFAWRESQNNGAQADAARIDSSYQKVKQEYARAAERALAVVNLAAATPEMTREIVSRGEVALGPESDTTGGGRYNATASFVAAPATMLVPLGIDATSSQPRSGAAIIDGRPVAIAVSPVSSDQGTAGFILVIVDLANLASSVGAEGENVFFAVTGADGTVVPIGVDSFAAPSGSDGGRPIAASSLSAADLARLSSGSPVEVATAGAGNKSLTYYPLPGPAQWPLTIVAIQKPAESAGVPGKANPLLGLAVLTIAIGLFIAHILARTMSRPVERITEATERVAAGDIAYQLPHQKGRDELSVLGDSFNRMTQKYRRSQGEVEAAAVRLEQTVIAQDAEIQTLFGISRAITSILDVNFLLEQVLTLSMPLVGSRQGTVWLGRTNPENGEAPADLMPAITLGTFATEPLPTTRAPSGAATEPLPVTHEILLELEKRGWKVSVLLPASSETGADESRQEAARQLFFNQDEASAKAAEKVAVEEISGKNAGDNLPLRKEEDSFRESLRLPDGEGHEGGDRTNTQVVVPITVHEGSTGGILAMNIPGRRELNEHEALLIANIVGLASVAVENAGLFGLAQRRGEQIETLLRESHHRITNNLAAISGMLSVQLSQAGTLDAATVIRDNIARIGSIAQVHRLLSGEIKDEVDVIRMIQTICTPIVASTAAGIELAVTGPRVTLPAKQATPLALIANELAINSIKHGFSGRQHGKIDLSISLEAGDIIMNYHDDGAGLAGVSEGVEDETGAAGSGLGTQIINSLVRDELGGDWKQLPGSGYTAKIHFPQKGSGH